ncbi:MAG: hypothetical protein HY736_06635 [Verrucomicrobia bacterium]|nr:hypothetical protein [Verrucomicrobiota bacterium]
MLHLLRLFAAVGFFSVPVLAASFPKPEPEKTFADLKVYAAQGRPWRAAIEDWAGARRRVAGDPAWTEWLDKERRHVDAWIAKHRDRVEWAAGWSHDGISPKDASRVIWSGKIPREETQFFFSPSDPQIEITDKLFAWWVRVTLATPGEFKLWHGSSPDVPPQRRESFYLELTTPATSATFTTKFEPVK